MIKPQNLSFGLCCIVLFSFVASAGDFTPSSSNATDGFGVFSPGYQYAGSGGYFDYDAAHFSYFCNTIETAIGDMNNDGKLDVVLLADGALNAIDDAYVAAPLTPASYLWGAWGPHTISNSYGLPDPYYSADPSPNIVAGLKGDPNGNRYVGSDLAWYENVGNSQFLMHFITPRQCWVPLSPSYNTFGYDNHSGPYSNVLPNSSPVPNPHPAHIHNAKHIKLADLDNDGDLDIVVWNNDGATAASDLGASSVSWFENKSKQGNPGEFNQWMIAQRTKDGPPNDGTNNAVTPREGTVADINNDGLPDIIVAEYTGNALYAYLNDPSLTLPPRFSVATYVPLRKDNGDPIKIKSIFVIKVVDLNNDGRNDIILGSNFSKKILYWESAPPNTDPKWLEFKQDTIASNFEINSLDAADFNNDGRLDVVAGGQNDMWSNKNSDPIAVFISRNKFNGWDKVNMGDFGNVNKMGPRVYLAASPHTAGGPDKADIIATAAWTPGAGCVSGTPCNLNTVSLLNRSEDTDVNGEIEATEVVFSPIYFGTPNGAMTNLALKGDESHVGLAIEDLNGDGIKEIVSSGYGSPLQIFNPADLDRRFRVRTTIQKNGVHLRATGHISVESDNSAGQILGLTVGQEK